MSTEEGKPTPESLVPPPESLASETRELFELHDRLASITRTAAGRNIPVKISSNERWYYMRQFDRNARRVIDEFVHLPERTDLRSESAAKGAAAHEGAHVRISRLEVVPDEVMQTVGFHALFMAMEERPTDHDVRARFEGGAEWIDETRHSLWEKGQRQSDVASPEAQSSKMGQMSSLIIFERQMGGIALDVDDDVRGMFEGFRKDLARCEDLRPPEGASEIEVLKYQKERYKVVYNRLWPKFKQLVNADAMFQRNALILKYAQEGRLKAEPWIVGTIKEALEEVVASEDGEVWVRPNRNSPAPEIQTLIDELYRKLEEEQAEFDELLRKLLEALEDSLVQQITNGAMYGSETHEEYRKRIEIETQEGEARDVKRTQEAKRQAERTAAEETLRKLREQMEAQAKDPYQVAYETIAPYDDALYARLHEIFHPNLKSRVRLKSSGSRLNLPAVFRWEADRRGGAPVVDNRLFETIELPEKRDYAITLLVDLSGSMSDDGKIENTFAGVILLAEVLSRLGIKCEILGFQKSLMSFKAFDEEMSDDVRKRMSRMPKLTLSWDATNHDAPNVEAAANRLEEQEAKRKIMLVFSDGNPAGPYTYDTEDDFRGIDYDEPSRLLHEAIARIMRTTEATLVGLGLGNNTEHVRDFYPTSIANIDVHALPETLSDLLEDLIQNPEKYS